MPEPEAATHVRLALHPDYSSAVTATITGPSPYRARATLFLAGFRRIDDQTTALARIDHDEPHYADKAAQALRDTGATVEIDATLQEEIDTEWTYGNYPMPWLTREEVREVSAEAQRRPRDGLAPVRPPLRLGSRRSPSPTHPGIPHGSPQAEDIP